MTGAQFVDADSTLMHDVVGWDVRTFSTAVEFWDDQVRSADVPLRCLEIGAGPGGPSLWLALAGHDVVCSNWANTSLDASPLHDRYDFPGTITYEDIDAKAIGYVGEFDLIVFKSVLGGLGSDGGQSQHTAMESILSALKPGGRLIFAENVRGTIFHRMARALANRRRGASWYYIPLAQLTQLLGRFDSYELHTTGVSAVFGVTEAQRRRLASLDRVLNRITPARWRYMAYGVATKASS